MTGIRSWTAEVTAFGVVVKIEQVLTQFLRGQSKPANEGHFKTGQRE